jgi:hypothetical protein
MASEEENVAWKWRNGVIMQRNENIMATRKLMVIENKAKQFIYKRPAEMLQCKRDNAEKIVMKIAIVNGNGGYSNQ